MYDIGFIDYIDSNNNDFVMWQKFSIVSDESACGSGYAQLSPHWATSSAR
jgi:hypothetical protein